MRAMIECYAERLTRKMRVRRTVGEGGRPATSLDLGNR